MVSKNSGTVNNHSNSNVQAADAEEVSRRLRKAQDYLEERLVAPAGTIIIMLLWAIATYLFEQLQVFPRLGFVAPSMGSGKSTGLNLLEHIVAGPDRAADLTGPNLFRLIEEKHRHKQPLTLLLDEGEHYLGKSEMQTVLNSGWQKQGAYARRLEQRRRSSEWSLKKYSTWAPAAYGMNGKPPGTLADRSILIQMSRARPKIYMDDEQAQKDLADVRIALKTWKPTLNRDAKFPEWLQIRARQRWLALFQIAEALGPEWVKDLEAACASLENQRGSHVNFAVMLLTLTKVIFDETGCRFISPTRLRYELVDRYPDKLDGERLTTKRLAQELSSFSGLEARSARPRDENEREWCRDPDKNYEDGKPETARAYHREDFEPHWKAYCGSGGPDLQAALHTPLGP